MICARRAKLRSSRSQLGSDPYLASIHDTLFNRVTRSQIRSFVEASSVERIREVLDLLQKLKRHVPLSELPQHEVPFLLDLRDHEEFFKTLADAKLQQ